MQSTHTSNVMNKEYQSLVISGYDQGIKDGDFYEEPIGDDFEYPDW